MAALGHFEREGARGRGQNISEVGSEIAGASVGRLRVCIFLDPGLALSCFKEAHT